MGERAYIALIEPDGTGQYTYLGQGCYPDDAGQILLEHYQGDDAARRLMERGSITQLGESPETTPSYHEVYGHDWETVKPVTFTGGIEFFFQRPYLPGPEWLYAWNRSGWLAAKVTTRPPRDWLEKLGTLPDDEFQAWFDHNQEPAWVEWREKARVSQMPKPLGAVIQQYTEEKRARMAEGATR